MKTIYLTLLLALSCTFSFSQKVLVADKFFDDYAYIKASELYESIVEKGDSTEHVLTRLADCYYNNSKSNKAVFWYAIAIEKYPNIHPEYIYKHIQSLRSVGQDEKADIWLEKFKEIEENDDRAKALTFLKNNTVVTDKDSTYVEITNIPINSFYSDFGGYFHKNQFIFSSTRNYKEKTDQVKKVYQWNQEPFLDIFKASVTYDSVNNPVYSNIAPINSKDINTEFHEATITLTNDGKTMYFTRDNTGRRNKIVFNEKGTSHLKIYKASLIENLWQNIKELPFNGSDFSTGHPTLSPDNKQLFFVSDRFGGRGQTDIYVVDILGENKYSKPRNLGLSVNTKGREMFPFVGKDSILYFSSDGHENIGLLDTFKSNYLFDKSAKPENLGIPFNSRNDDFAFYIEPKNKKGYISSNRAGGKGNDDIYAFEYVTVKLVCYQIVKGIVRDKKTNLPIKNATVSLYDSLGKIIKTASTNGKGEYELEADCNQEYKIIGKKQDYKQDIQGVTTSKVRKKIHHIDLFLTPLIQDDQIVINPIYFDFDKSNIRPDAAFELENIVTVMTSHPNMVIKIEAHTDSQGSDVYNRALSDRRAKSTRNYIYSRGIEPGRIESAIGFGESQILNRCHNRVKCTDKEHEVNRRSYFYILTE